MGLAVEYVASYSTPVSGNDYRWSRRLRARLRAVIAEAEPDAVVFDGTHPYEALLGALPYDGLAVWCRRPLWRQGSSRVPLGRAGAFDAVLEPGELAESADRGPTVALRDRAHRVGPIVLLDRTELLARERAEAELGLVGGRTNVLVALGQGTEVGEATRRCLRRLAGRDDVRVAALSSALAALGEVPEGVVELRATYPMSRYFAAFDAAVSAAGYNAFHELIALGVPSLFVPMARETDDQPARARWAADAGLGLAVDGPADPGLDQALDHLLDPSHRDPINTRLATLDSTHWRRRRGRVAHRPRRPRPRREDENVHIHDGIVRSSRTARLSPALGHVLCQRPAHGRPAHAPAADRAARPGARARGRDRARTRSGRGRGRARRGGRVAAPHPGGHRRARRAGRDPGARGRGRACPRPGLAPGAARRRAL